MGSLSVRCYCAFCKSERSVYAKAHMSPLDAFFALVASFTLMFLIWQEFNPKVCIFIAVSMGMAELFVMTRRRFSLVCHRCGFDPVLYKTNPALAAERVKNFLAQRKEDPLSLFVPPPQLPVIRKTPSDKRA